MRWDWILEHWQLVIAVAGAFAVWLNQRKREREGKPADYDEDGIPETRAPRSHDTARELTSPGRGGTFTGGGEHDDDETRRAREEIRRKIAERRAAGGGALPPAAPPPVIITDRPPPEATQPPLPVPADLPPFVRELLGDRRARETSPPVPPPPAPRPPPPVVLTRETVSASDSGSEHEAPEYLEEGPAPAPKRARPVSAYGQAANLPGARSAPASAAAAALRADLRSPAHLRRAVLLREILDRPVGLR